MHAPLTIYRASAGAGKTFRLVVEYIKLLMLRPDEYRHILAVTFTKKATQEMKTRILSQLYGLREGLSVSEGYMDCITAEMNISRQEVRKNAAKALELILSDYGHFRIETIDSFFQRVLRNMTRELDISSNMRVELNALQVKDKAIDEMIDNLEPTDHVFRRIVDFANENMSEGKTWNIVGGLKKFGENVFSDFYQSHSSEFNELQTADPDIFKNYGASLRKLRETAEEDIISLAEELRALIEGKGVDISIFSYSNKSGLGKMYEYFANGEITKMPATVRKYAQDAEAWLTKAMRKKFDISLIEDCFLPALRRFLDAYDKRVAIIATCKLLLRNLNNLELLTTIEAAVTQSNTRANRFLLTHTNHLLSSMIGDTDSPFIYEKIGTRISHLMIDEFQDTSTLQWKNFKRLLLESMSHYDASAAKGTVGSMIVGDVKQSIYRWRDGDWRLLDGIKREFDRPSDTEIIPLQTNFRSEANIIAFNNLFFNTAKALFFGQDASLPTPYDDVEQKPKPGRKPKGEVQFFMLTKEEYESRHQMICDHVHSLLQRGVKARDIAILARKNDVLKELAKAFMEHYPDIRVVSHESFQIDNSTAVNVIVSALRLQLNPSDSIHLAVLEKHSQMTAAECRQALSGISLHKPLLDIVEEIFALFRLERMTDDSAYICAFYDYLTAFTSQNTSTVRNFLKHWDESLSQKTIETEAADGVQMLTIHKSKGLEFDNVIIADGAWDYGLSRSRVWVEIDQEPFSDIPFSLLPVTEHLEDSVFASVYREEKMQNGVDNLNLLYVAFTRAVKNLYYYGKTSCKDVEIADSALPKEYSTQHISSFVEECLNSAECRVQSAESHLVQSAECRVQSSLNKQVSKDFNGIIFSFGEFAQPDSALCTLHSALDKDETRAIHIPIHTNKPAATFMQSNRSRQFVAERTQGDEEEQRSPSTEYMDRGLILHNVLSQIKTIDDVDSVLQRLLAEGVIPDKSLANLIRQRINGSEQTRSWFAPHWTVLNECSILTPDGVRRPDRVITDGKRTIVIDFKFGKRRPEHIEQVNAYKSLLEQMDFPDVQAYLWYVYEPHPPYPSPSGEGSD